ncbi:MAG: TIGR04086 family membrane protein [Clostridia bacterium]|nr:TIGR04086 family membrane protein [Clostridia bacterium]
MAGKRKNENKGAVLIRAAVKGTAVSVVISVALVLIFALVLTFVPIPDRAVEIINQVMKIVSVMVGTAAGMGASESMGAIKGASVGSAYMILGVLSASLLAPPAMPYLTAVGDVLMGAGIGALTGTLRARRAINAKTAARAAKTAGA